MPTNRRIDRPVIHGILGDSAAGKTTISAGIAAVLGHDRVATVCTDDYHKHNRKDRAKAGLSALDPQANHIDILEQHIRLLRSGEPILKPTYNHDTGQFGPCEYIEPKEYIIVEGLLGYATRAMRDCYDVKVYLGPDEALRTKWKIQRDVSRRGYTSDEVLAELDRRKLDRVNHIHPQRTFADMVVRFYAPDGRSDESGAHLNVRHTLRPTLPHPDLSPILDAGAKSGFRLELARDIDGKPVDVLEISGDIDDRRAKQMEDLLWSLIPEASHLRAKLGEFTDDQKQVRSSHPLALSQLLITYHLVKAAMGHYAV